jgi:methyltransferase-like protein
MHNNYQQSDLQTLIDLLAEETEKYTKAFIIGSLKGSSQQRAIINALVEEINIRKNGAIVHNAEQGNSAMTNNFPCC